MFERHITVLVEDLHCLELYCDGCGNGTLLDVENEKLDLPTKCSRCGFNDDFRASLIEFRNFRKAMRRFKKHPQFRIKEQQPEPPGDQAAR